MVNLSQDYTLNHQSQAKDLKATVEDKPREYAELKTEIQNDRS